jgi:hypothetical protein
VTFDALAAQRAQAKRGVIVFVVRDVSAIVAGVTRPDFKPIVHKGSIRS